MNKNISVEKDIPANGRQGIFLQVIEQLTK